MTGDELKRVRQAAGLSQQQLGARIGISWQTIGALERLGGEDVMKDRPRESSKTKLAKQKLRVEFSFMQAVGALYNSLQLRFTDPELMIPAPCDYPYYIIKGDPLILTDEAALPGDLVVLRDADGKLSMIGRVKQERLGGDFLVVCPRQAAQSLPSKREYKTVEYYMHREHDGIPDIPKWEGIQPDMT